MSIFGSGISNSGSCRFGRTLSEGRKAVSSSLLLCKTPRSSAGSIVSVEVSNNGVEYTQRSLRFMFIAGAEVHRVRPSSASESAGGIVTVSGVHFDNSVGLVCGFGSRSVVSGGWLSSTRMLCSVPAGMHRQQTTVEASNDGMHFSENGQQIELGEVAREDRRRKWLYP